MKKIIPLLFITTISFATESNDPPKNKEYNLKASYYSNKFNGRKCANGSIFYNNKLTAASNLYPLNSLVEVINEFNKKSVIVKITDRIHPKFGHSRIDLTRIAFEKIGNIKSGLIKVTTKIFKDTINGK